MKKYLALVTAVLLASTAIAQAGDGVQRNNRVVFRGNFVGLTKSRGGETFTDTLGTGGVNNDGKTGFGVSAALDLGMMEPGTILGVASIMGGVSVDFARFSRKSVRQATSFLVGGAGGSVNSNVNVTELNVGVAPKLRFDNMGKFQPYLMPVGLAFLVISPPSNDTTYLDLGLNFGAGFDYRLLDWLSVGIDGKYTHSFDMTHSESAYYTVGAGVGVHF